MCLAYPKNANSGGWGGWDPTVLQPCDNVQGGHANTWEFKENGAVVGANHPKICLTHKDKSSGYMEVIHNCDYEADSVSKFWWITKKFMLTHQDDGDTKCMFFSTTYNNPYLSSAACGFSSGKNEFMLTSNGMIYDGYDGRALTRSTDTDRAYWSSNGHGGANQVFSFTIDGKLQVSDTEECLVTSSRKDTFPTNPAHARLFFGDCDYLGYQKLIVSSEFEQFGNRHFDSSHCLWFDHLGNERSELFMRKCDEVGEEDMHSLNWMLVDGQLLSTTAEGTNACVEVDSDGGFVYISTLTCPSSATFSYDYDTFKIKVIVEGEERCLDAIGPAETTSDGIDSTTVILSDCDGRSHTKMWGIRKYSHDTRFLRQYAHFHDGYSTIFSPEYGSSMCLGRAEEGTGIVLLDEPNEDEPSCDDTYWYLKADTKQLTPAWDRSRCLDSNDGVLTNCDPSSSVSESQQWSFDRTTLLVHSTWNDEERCLSLATRANGEVYLTTASVCNRDDPLQRFGPSWKPIEFNVEDLPGTIKNVYRSGDRSVWWFDHDGDDDDSVRLKLDFSETFTGDDSEPFFWMLHTDGTLSSRADPYRCAMVMNDKKLKLVDCTDEAYVKTFYYDTETLRISYNEYHDDGSVSTACIGFVEESNGTIGFVSSTIYVKGGFDCSTDGIDAYKLEWIM